MEGWRPPAWAPPALIGLTAALVCAPVLFGGRVLYWGTPLLQFYAWRTQAAEMLRAGFAPLWIHSLGNGAPLLANHQTAPYYPLNFLYLIFPVERAFGYSAALHLFLAGLGAWLLCRALCLSRFAALVGALSYMLSAYMVTRLNFPTMTCAAAWMPFLLLCAERLLTRRRLTDALSLAVVIALQALAGHAQLWYYSLWALGLYALWRCATQRATDARLSTRVLPLGMIAVAVAAGAALAAVQLIPTAELAWQSQRQSGAEYDFAMTYSMWPWRILTLFAPDFFGSPAHGDYWGYGNYWEDAGYVGILPLLFIAPAIIGWRAARRAGRRRLGLSLVPFLLALALVSLLLALGKNLPFYPLLFRYVPGFGLFQAPARLLYWTTLALTLLGAIGADHVRLWAGRGKAARLIMVIGLGVLAAAVAAQLALPAVKTTFASALIRSTLLLILAGAVLLFSDLKLQGRLGWLAGRWRELAILLLAADLISFGLPFNPTTTPAAYHAPNRTAALLQSMTSEPYRVFIPYQAEYDIKYRRYLSFKAFDAGEPAQQTALRETLVPDTNVQEGIDSAGNFDPLLLGRYAALMDAIKAADSDAMLRLLGMMNVVYVLSPEPIVGLTPADDGSLPTHVYRNPYALPRAWWTPAALCAADGEDALRLMSRADFDPRRAVILEGCQEAGAPAAAGGGALAAVALRYRPNAVTISVDAPAAGYLVLADTYYPGWKATVDGKPSVIQRANFAFRAVAVPAGSHTVDFQYAPLSFTVGQAVSGVALAGILAGLVLCRRRRESNPEDTSQHDHRDDRAYLQ